MVKKISKAVTSYFLHKNIIDKRCREMCEYVIQSKIFYALHLIVASVILLQRIHPLQVVVFYMVLELRKLTGGYHTKTEGKCFVLSLVVSIISMFLVYPLSLQLEPSMMCGILILATSMFMIGWMHNPFDVVHIVSIALAVVILFIFVKRQGEEAE